MGQKVSVELVDDVDGSVAESTVEFGLDGIHYAIDLSADNAAELHDRLAAYVAQARRTGGRPRRGGTRRATSSGDTVTSTLAERRRNQAIRDWAHQQGMEVSDRGRLPAGIVQAYERAQ